VGRARNRRGRGSLVLRFAFGIIILLLAWMTWSNVSRMFGAGGENPAVQAVAHFYELEQAGDFGSSWELFHPLMQQRFDKSTYIRNRAQSLMQDFGVDTFDFSLGKPERLTDWRQSEGAAPISEVYRIVATLLFKSPYGNFEIVQPCLAAYDAGEWKLLWSYNDTSLSDFPAQ
jgi:hypothetical protein